MRRIRLYGECHFLSNNVAVTKNEKRSQSADVPKIEMGARRRI